MFQKLLFPGILFISIVLLSFDRLYAQEEEGEIVIISERVGEKIDLEERNKYNLFPAIKGFQSAVLLNLLDGSYVLKIIYLDETTGEEKVKRIPRSEWNIKRYRDIIDHFEEIQTSFPEYRKRVARASGNASYVVTEFLAGSLAGFSGSIVGGRIGRKINPCYSDDCISGGELLGFMGGSVIGSSSAVYLTGRLLGETGSYRGALIGSVVGTSSILLTTLLAGALCGGCSWAVYFLSDLLLPSAGATIGFNRQGQKDSAAIHVEEGDVSFAFPSLQMQPPTSEALLHIEDSKLRLRVPSPTFRPILLSKDKVTWEYQIKLVSVRF